MKNTFIIFASLVRRFDELHNKLNTMHLQASVAAIRGKFDYTNNKYWADNLTQIGTNNKKDNKNILIIRVYPESYFNENEVESPNIAWITPNVAVLEVTMQTLIGNLIFDKTSQKRKIETMHQIFGNFHDKIKDAESISSNCLF